MPDDRRRRDRTWIEILLDDWGGYKRSENRSGLGYPTAAPFTRDPVQGGRSSDDSRGTVDHDILRLNDIMEADPPLIPHEWIAILVQHHLHTGPSKIKAARVGLARARYYDTLKSAQLCVHALLENVKEKRRRQLQTLSGQLVGSPDTTDD